MRLNDCTCRTVASDDCPACNTKRVLESPRGKLAARLLEARITAFGPNELGTPQALATAALQRADALIKELLK